MKKRSSLYMKQLLQFIELIEEIPPRTSMDMILMLTGSVFGTLLLLGGLSIIGIHELKSYLWLIVLTLNGLAAGLGLRHAACLLGFK